MTHPCTSLLTDKYELTMLAAALRDGTAGRRATFEVFARRLPDGRRYGVVAGTGRLLEALAEFRFGPAELESVSTFLDEDSLEYLAAYRFGGDIDGYPEGELYFPGPRTHPAWLLRRMRHPGDPDPVDPESRQRRRLRRRPHGVGGRRPTAHRDGIAPHSRTRGGGLRPCGLSRGLRIDIQSGGTTPLRCACPGTAAHAFTLLHAKDGMSPGEAEREAFRAQVEALGVGTTLLVDTYDITAGVENAIAVAGTALGAVRIDSGDLGMLARQVRAQLDALGAHRTRIVVSGDLDEYSIAALRARPSTSTGGHLGGDRLGNTDRGYGLQARRNRWHSRG